jgi:tRNA G10  N-methylase Trm11
VHARAAVDFVRWDAGRLALADASVDVVASNLPFGRQAGAGTDLPALYARVAAEVARVVRPGGRAVLLTTRGADLDAALAPFRDADTAQPALRVTHRREISLFGQTPEVVVVSVKG